MDVLLVDDKDGEVAVFAAACEARGHRFLHTDDLSHLDVLAGGRRPRGWPEPPFAIAAAVIDLDLGHKGPGPAGGLVAVDRVRQMAKASGRDIAVVFRCADVDDDRSLAAVLAAELVDAPIPLWGKSTGEAVSIVQFLEAEPGRRSATVDELDGSWIHPVRFSRTDARPTRLGQFLYSGKRRSVWQHLHAGIDIETATLYAGYRTHNKFWESMNDLIAALNHLREEGDQLHRLEGQQVRLSDIDVEIARKVIRDLEIAMDAISLGQVATTEETRPHLLGALRDKRDDFVRWLDHDGKKPTQNRNVEQGEFLGVFGRVLGHPDAVELFSA